jgi:predicted lipid carrier protein YhbT
MESVDSVNTVRFNPSRAQAFTVLIPRALQPTVNALPTEVRQRVLAELFSLASRTSQERAGEANSFTYAMRLEVADCVVSVEMDDPRSRLMLTGLSWNRPQHA